MLKINLNFDFLCAKSIEGHTVGPPEGVTNLPCIVVDGAGQCISRATRQNAYWRFYCLFPIRTLHQPINHLQNLLEFMRVSGYKTENVKKKKSQIASWMLQGISRTRKTTHLMQQPIPRYNDNAIPLWQRDLSDQLPGVILAL